MKFFTTGAKMAKFYAISATYYYSHTLRFYRLIPFHNTENGFCVLRVKARGQVPRPALAIRWDKCTE